MQIPLVDLDDQIIGAKDRSDLDFEKDIFRTASLWITNAEGEVLLAQRKHNKKVDPGKWAEAVGGTVEGDDSYEETVRREAEEELGLKNLVITPGPKQFITVPCRYFVQWYVAEVNQDISAFTVQEEEIEQVAWIAPERLLHELKTQPEKYIPAMRDIVALFVHGGAYGEK